MTHSGKKRLANGSGGRLRAPVAQGETGKRRAPRTDTLIALQAVARKLTLVTNNEREFRRVAGLSIEQSI
jgi:predicted nucleic acid-binding protein